MRLLLLPVFFTAWVQGIARSPETPAIHSSQKPGVVHFLPVAGTLLGTSFLLDEPVNRWINSHQRESVTTVFEITDLAGDKYVMVPAAILAYGSARLIIRDEKLQMVTWQSIQSLAVSALATEGIKQITGRARPGYGHAHNYFDPFPGGNNTYKSLPSGHAAISFSIFTPFAEHYSRWYYLIPLTVAAGRVYQNQHWLSDVVAGSCIGWISGYLFAHSNRVQVIPNGVVICF